MKKLLLLSLIGCILIGCEDSNTPDPGKENPPLSCKIISPTAGEWKLGTDLVVSGQGADTNAELIAVTLSVGGKKIESVNTLPFTHTVDGKDLVAGEMVIRLDVEDKFGTKAHDEVKITVKENLTPTCEILEPADRARIIKEGGLTIKANGSDQDGEIVGVVLLINDKQVATAAAMPFEHTIEPGDLEAGAYKIAVEAEDDQGAKGRHEINITIADNVAPECNIISPANNAQIVIEDGFTIVAEGEDPDGEITRVTLKLGTKEIASINSLPIEHRVEPSDLTLGSLTISLEVEDNYGAKTSSEVTINIIEPIAGMMTDPRDGKTYKTVDIGTQTWMAENLAYLPAVNDPDTGSENNDGEPYYYVYGYHGTNVTEAKASAYYSIDGVLYNWFAATGRTKTTGGDKEAVPSGVQGICPDGWHLPSKGEWAILTEYVYNNIEPTECYEYDLFGDISYFEDYNISGALKSVDGWEPYTESGYPGLGAGSDLFGFTAKAAGGRLSGGSDGFYYRGQQCNFLATDYNLDRGTMGAGYINVSRIAYDVGQGFTGPERGYSVRCLKN